MTSGIEHRAAGIGPRTSGLGPTTRLLPRRRRCYTYGPTVRQRTGTTTVNARTRDAMRLVGRCGQFLGLALPALAILLELNRQISLGQMLTMLVAAVCCFAIGRILEGFAAR
jgi:hypothetical protein